jgi:hypothetical protein
MSLDFAEHVPGQAFRYKHGWKLISGENWARDVKPGKEHVLDMWRECNPDELEAGRNWYENANYVASSIAKSSGLSLHQAAGILAVYSPQTGWSTNLLRAAQVMRTKKPVGGKGSGVFATTRQRNAAQRILNGESYEKVLSGQKIKAFARLIEDPHRPDVVIDRHAMSVAAGTRAPGDVVSPKSLKRYKAWSKAYVEAAKDLTRLTGKPVYPHQIQAATWLARQRKNQELELTRRKSSAVASNAEDQWDDWHDYAEANFPGLLEHAPSTGYEFTGEYEPTLEADFAEHIAGTAIRYHHGWKPVFGGPYDSMEHAVRYSSAIKFQDEAQHKAEMAFHDAAYKILRDTPDHRGYRNSELWDGAYYAKNPGVTFELPDGSPEQSWGMYQAEGYYEQINGYLRGGDEHVVPGNTISSEKMASGMTKAFDKFGVDTDKPYRLYRGMTNNPEHNWLRELKVGDTYTDKGVVSTSADPDDVTNFLAENNKDDSPKDNVMLEIHVPKGVRVLGGTVIGSETMLLPSMTYKIVSVGKITTHPAEGQSIQFTKFVVEVVK